MKAMFGRVGNLINPAKLAKGGIGAKLQIAFGVVALMTVAASGLAILSFRSAEQSVANIAEREVPLMTEALRLSVMSGEISAAAARFVAANNIRDQRQIAAQIEDRSMQLRMLIEKVRAGSSKDAFSAVDVASRLLENNLSDLDTVIVARSNLRTMLDRKLDALHKLHNKITDQVTPLVNASYVNAVNKAEDIGKVGDKTVKALVDDGVQTMQTVVQIGTETNLATGLLTAGALANSPALLAMLEDRFTASARRAEKHLASLPKVARYNNLRERTADLLKLADFKRGGASDNEAARLQNVFRAHEGLANVLITLIDDLNFDTVMQGEQAVKRTGTMVRELIDDQLVSFRNALELKIQTHLIASLISEGAVAKDKKQLAPISERFSYSANMLMLAAQNLENAAIRKDIDALIEIGQASDGVFALRDQELNANAGAERVIAENVKIQKQLDQAVSGLVKETENGMKGGTAALLSELGHSRMLLIVVAIASLIGAFAIAFFYVQRSLMRRLTTTCDTMRRLASGDNTVTIAGVKDSDEIGDMARALTVFRDAAIEKERVEAAAAEDRRMAEEERSRSDAA
ncbi:MAG: HAMP domain-containing protein, partial [Pseudorhodoplanes sp.]